MAKSIFGAFKSPSPADPLESAVAARGWFEDLPANDPLGATLALAGLIEKTYSRRPPVTTGRIVALLEMDRLSLPLQAQIQAQNRMPKLSPEVRDSVWNAYSALVRWMASAWEHVFRGREALPAAGQPAEHLHAIFARLFHYQAAQAQLGLLRYEQWVPSRWLFLHEVYEAAVAQGVATRPFALPGVNVPGEGLSAEQEYLLLLLMQRINTGNLTGPQIVLSAEWMRAIVPSLALAKMPPVGSDYWVLDLALADGLSAAPPAGDEDDIRYLDTAPLRAALTNLMEGMNRHLAQGADAGDRIETKERLALAKRLQRLWLPHGPPQPRRGERKAEKRAVLVASGWTDIPALMRRLNPWMADEPFRYSYGDGISAALAPTSAVRPPEPTENMPSLRTDRRGWEILDVSESGYRIQSRTQAATKLHVGNLLALLIEGDDRKHVGIVRRLKRRTTDHTEIGVEIIAENALPMAPEPLDVAVDALGQRLPVRTFPAIYLPPKQGVAVPPVRCLILPTSEFKPGRRLTLKTEGLTNDVRLAVLIEYTKDWVWTTFEPEQTWRDNVRV